MAKDLKILNANIGRTNVAEFDDFSKIAIETLDDICNSILPLCGADALHELIIYRNLANDFTSNVFCNDGKLILNQIEYLSPIQTYLANYIRYIAEKVERCSGDGTSTAIYLATKLIISCLKEIQTIRKNADGDTHHRYRYIMEETNKLATHVEAMLELLQDRLKTIVVDVQKLDRKCRAEIIYKLAHTTSKGNEKLARYAVDLFVDIPEILYEHVTYKQLNYETDEDFKLDKPEHDICIAVRPSNNTVYNTKLNTEFEHDDCDLLVIPSMYDKLDLILGYLSIRKADSSVNTRQLVILYNGSQPNDDVRLEMNVDRDFVTVCRQTAYNEVFVSNPLELKTIRVMAGVSPIIQDTIADVEDNIIKNVKCRIYGKYLYLTNLFEHTDDAMHPSYSHPETAHPEYNQIKRELEEHISSLDSHHNRGAVATEVKEFIRIYRNLICSRLPILTVGGNTINNMSNVSIVEDVLGVVSVSLKHGVVLDLMPRLEQFSEEFATMSQSSWAIEFDKAIKDFASFTYKDDDICCCYKFTVAGLDDPIVVHQADGSWAVADAITSENIEGLNIKVVQSYRAISETLFRLIETVPRILRTDRIIVPDSVMDTKKE